MSSYLWIFHLPDNSMISEVEALSAEVKAESAETTISCKITGLAAKATVVWLDGPGGTDVTTVTDKADFTVEQGDYNGGAQTPTLKVKANSAKSDKNYVCQVTSTSPATSDSSETAVPLNVYGEIQERVSHD